MPERLGPGRLAADRQRLAQWRWLASTRELQEEAYGHDFRAMGRSARLVCDYLTHMVFAAINELVEAAYEFEWKRWTSDKAWYDRDQVVEELIDAAHFIGNAAVALNVTDEEWARRYMAKQDKNRRRMAERYGSRRSKPSAPGQ